MNKNNVKFCKICGKKLITSKVKASEVFIPKPLTIGGGSKEELDFPFDEKTGKENIATLLVCPKWERHWLWGANEHCKVVLYRNIIRYLS